MCGFTELHWKQVISWHVYVWNVSRDVSFNLLLGLHSSGRINIQVLRFMQPAWGTEGNSQKYCSFICTKLTITYLFAFGQGRRLISKVLTSSHKLTDCFVPSLLGKGYVCICKVLICWLLQWPQGYGVRFI